MSARVTPPDVVHPRAIRSFVRRTGRVTTGQAKAFEALGPDFILPHQAKALDVERAFGALLAGHPLVLEIGFGMGEATAHIAGVLPDTRFLCCEVHEPGVGALLKRIGEHGLRNIRIVAHDAVEVLRDMIPHGTLDGVHVFFPDPWHKKRHHKRRLIQPPLVLGAKGEKLSKQNGATPLDLSDPARCLGDAASHLAQARWSIDPTNPLAASAGGHCASF